MLPTAPYFKSNDGRISTVCEDQYSSTLAMLEETADEAFKVYMTLKTQGWYWGWGCPRPSDAAASPGPGAAPGGEESGAGAATPARPLAPAASDDGEASAFRPHRGGGRRRSGAIANLELGDVASNLPPGFGGRAHAIQDFKTSASHRPSSPVQEAEEVYLRVYSH